MNDSTDSKHRTKPGQMVQSLMRAIDAGSYEEVESATKSLLLPNIEVDFEPDVLSKLLASLINYGLVPPVNDGNDRELDKKDFEYVSRKCVQSCICLRAILMKVQIHQIKNCLVPLIVFCGQHKEASLWSEQTSIQYSKETLELLLHKYGCESLQQLLTNADDISLVKKLFSYFLPHLNRSNWKCNPGMKVCFIRCLQIISHPHLKDAFNEVLPPSLLFVDDFVVENRISGIKCLLHILDNVPKATLQWYDRAEVIHNALKNLVYNRDPEIISVLYACLLKVLQILEVDPKNTAQIRKINRYDELYQLLLQQMDNEQLITVRMAYSKHLQQFINIMGITIVRYLKITIRVLQQYLEVYDGAEEITRLNCLTALQALILVCWSRIDDFIPAIVKGIVRLLYDINSCQSKPKCKDEVIQSSIKILRQLYFVNPALMDEICKPLLNHIEEIPTLKVVEEMWKL